jgi:hypothetical protein
MASDAAVSGGSRGSDSHALFVNSVEKDLEHYLASSEERRQDALELVNRYVWSSYMLQHLVKKSVDSTARFAMDAKTQLVLPLPAYPLKSGVRRGHSAGSLYSQHAP